MFRSSSNSTGDGRRRQRQQVLPNLGSMQITAGQKQALTARAQIASTAPPFVHPDLSFFNPPADSQSFKVTPQNGFPSYPAVGASAIQVVAYVVPKGRLAVIRLVAIAHVGGNPPDGTGIVIWRLLKNGSGIRGLNALYTQVGTMANPQSMVILGIENDIIAITAECPALLPSGAVNPGPPGGSTTAGSLDGFTVPLSEATLGSGFSGGQQ